MGMLSHEHACASDAPTPAQTGPIINKPFSRVHEIKSFIDFIQWHCVCYKLVDFQFTSQVVIDQLWNTTATLPTCLFNKSPLSSVH